MKQCFKVTSSGGWFYVVVDYDGEVDIDLIDIPWELFEIVLGNDEDDEARDWQAESIEPVAETPDENVEFVFDVDYWPNVWAALKEKDKLWTKN